MMYALFLVVFLCYSNCAFPALGWAWSSVSSLWSLQNEKIEEIPWTLSKDDKTSNDLLESISLYHANNLLSFGEKKIEEEMFLYDKQGRGPLDWALYTWKQLQKKDDFWISDADAILKKLIECGADLKKEVAWQLIAQNEKEGRAFEKTYLNYIKEDSVLKERVYGWLDVLIKQKDQATLPEAKDEKEKQLKRIASWKNWREALIDKREKKPNPDKDAEVLVYEEEGD